MQRGWGAKQEGCFPDYLGITGDSYTTWQRTALSGQRIRFTALRVRKRITLSQGSNGADQIEWTNTAEESQQ